MCFVDETSYLRTYQTHGGASKTELGIKGYKITEYRSTTGRKPKVGGEAEPIIAVYALFLPLNVG